MHHISRAAALLTGMVFLTAAMAWGENSGESGAPRYRQHRFDEEYRYLLDPARRTDFWDPVKYLPLDVAGSRYLSLGGEARERYEYYNNGNWGAGPQDSGGSLLHRYLLHADLRLGEPARFFSQLKSGLVEGRNGGPRPTDEDQLDLHQLFLDLSAGFDSETRLTLRSGRQELAFGSQRLVSVREGPNVRQSFDGFRLIWQSDRARLDGFAVKPVETNRHVFDDGPDNTRAFWGVYSVLPFPLLPGGNADIYYMGLYRREARFDQGSARETRHSAGTRLWGKGDPWDYNFEFVYQWGSFGDGAIRAWTAASDTGFTIGSAPFHPRIALKANIASGDEDPNDKDLQTFNALFPKGSYFSEAALVGPANFFDLQPSVEFRPDKNITVTLDWDFFWRESLNDGIYGNAVNLVRSGTASRARYVGSQPEVQVEWQADRHLLLAVNYSHFFAGRFLKESGPAKDVDYVSSWVSYKF